ncbi:MAG: helix-turn-helix transcriptional regulator [Candidatus Gracilibacteria bacterium]|nr:helix-turn-helix transcriptional regulator [Candidatus Gracilibacteria bacterium]
MVKRGILEKVIFQIEFFGEIYIIHRRSVINNSLGMQEKCNKNNLCPVIVLMNMISKKWVLLILKSMQEGCTSYSEIEKNLVGINPRILSSRLSELQEFGFIEKKTLSTTPLKSIYCLTDKGSSFGTHISTMIDWTKKWM